MKDITRQVVILNHFYSPCIRQAILILNEDAEAEQTQIVAEAERIINAYLKNRQQPPRRRRRRRRIDVLCIAAVVIGIVLFAVSRFWL